MEKLMERLADGYLEEISIHENGDIIQVFMSVIYPLGYPLGILRATHEYNLYFNAKLELKSVDEIALGNWFDWDLKTKRTAKQEEIIAKGREYASQWLNKKEETI